MTFNTFAPALRILLLTAFLKLAEKGYITIAQANEFVRIIIELLTYAIPLAYAAWATWNARDVAQIERAAAIPEVKEIALKPTLAGTDLAKAAPSPKVIAK